MANKYRAKAIEIDGIRFASLREGQRYRDLKVLERVGQITNLELQPVFPLVCGDTPVKYDSGNQAKYIADFRYQNQKGQTIVEDVKGMDTPQSKLKRAVVRAQYGIYVEVVK